MSLKGSKQKNKSVLTVGLPRMHIEANEKRDFLPDFVARISKIGASVFLEEGYGSKMGISEIEYTQAAPGVRFTSHNEAYKQDIVLALRCPSDADLHQIRPGAVLISMLHYPTRTLRTRMIHSLGIEAISLDSIKDDSGRRLVENLTSVAWNGIEIAYKVLQEIYPEPGFFSPSRKPIRVTQLGSGAVGMHVMQAAIRYGDVQVWKTHAAMGNPGVEVTTIDYDLTNHVRYMKDILATTDILVDATQRIDQSQPVIRNEWIGWMPEHAVLLDLSVDPYACDHPPISVKGIEGIPHGNLDQYIFKPDDDAFNQIPDCIETTNRRHSVSCYSWPGLHPKECMEIYGEQIRPVMRVLLERGGIHEIRPDGKFFERAINRAWLLNWMSRQTLPG